MAAEKKSLAGFAAATVGREKNAVAKQRTRADSKVMAELSSGMQRRSLAQGSNGIAWLGNVRAKVGNVL